MVFREVAGKRSESAMQYTWGVALEDQTAAAWFIGIKEACVGGAMRLIDRLEDVAIINWYIWTSVVHLFALCLDSDFVSSINVEDSMLCSL
jgi:hypothetical protein